jgi:predicted hotdog family 3-hydroxylacyl-ACP dehydratase
MGPAPAGLQDWLPHRPPMLLLESVLEAHAQGGTALARVDPEAWYADADGAMPAWIGLELMAQAAAACRGAQRASAGPPEAAPRGGYLVAARGFRSELPAFPAGARLELGVQLEAEDPGGFCAFQCEIRYQGRPVAGATLRVMERP